MLPLGGAKNYDVSKLIENGNAGKHKIEKASRRSWAEGDECSSRAMQLREYTLKEFWEIFVDDRPFGADAMFRQVSVQSKAVFSYAMTMMDKIKGWEAEEKRVESKFAAWGPNLPRACGSTQKKL